MGIGRVVVAVVLGLMSIGLSSQVSAQALRGVRLRVDPTLFEYTRQIQRVEDITGSRTKVSSQTFGVFSSNVALGIGMSPSNNVNLGLNALIAATSVTVSPGDAESEVNSTTIWLVPYAEYVFNGEDTRGFLGLHAGLGSATASVGTGEAATGVIGTAGLSAGFHYFVNEHVSIDPHLRFLYTAGSVEDVDLSGIAFGIVLGVSAWMGESKAERDDQDESNRRTSEGDAFASPRSAPVGNPLAVRRGREGTLNGTISVNGVQVDLMADVTHPDVIAVRFQRMTPAHRAPTIQCSTWSIVLGDQRTEVTGAVYKGEPAGPGVQETLKSHVPVAALRALAPSTTAYGQPLGGFDACGVQMIFSISNRADLIMFFKRFDKMLQLNAASATPPAETPAETPVEAPTTPAATTPETPAPAEAPTAAPTVTTPTPSTPVVP